jgi:hypothetical protein
MGVLEAFSSKRNPTGRGAYIEGTPTPFWAFARPLRPFQGESAILSAWSSIGFIIIDKRYLSMVIARV